MRVRLPQCSKQVQPDAQKCKRREVGDPIGKGAGQSVFLKLPASMHKPAWEDILIILQACFVKIHGHNSIRNPATSSCGHRNQYWNRKCRPKRFDLLTRPLSHHLSETCTTLASSSSARFLPFEVCRLLSTECLCCALIHPSMVDDVAHFRLGPVNNPALGPYLVRTSS